MTVGLVCECWEVMFMWTAAHVLDAYLSDPNVYLLDHQRVVLEFLRDKIEEDGLNVEIVTDADLLPSVLMVFTRVNNAPPFGVQRYHYLTYVYTDFESDEDLLVHLIRRNRATVDLNMVEEAQEILNIIDKWPKGKTFSVFLGDYFLSYFVAFKRGNRILEQLPDTREEAERRYSEWFDRQIKIVSLKQELDAALAAKRFDECRRIKKEIDKLSEEKLVGPSHRPFE